VLFKSGIVWLFAQRETNVLCFSAVGFGFMESGRQTQYKGRIDHHRAGVTLSTDFGCGSCSGISLTIEEIFRAEGEGNPTLEAE